MLLFRTCSLHACLRTYIHAYMRTPTCASTCLGHKTTISTTTTTGAEKNPPGAPCTDVQARTATSAVQTAAGQCWVAAVRIFCSREIGREVRYHSISRISNVRSHGCFHLFAFAGLFSVLGGSSYSGFRLRNLVLAHHKVSVPSKLRRPSRKSRKLAQTLRTPKSEIQNHLGLRKP